MSTIESGTRSWANGQNGVKPTSRHFDRSYTRDVGMSKLATGALVFSSGSSNVTLAGAFAAFANNDDVLIEGTVNNNGFFIIKSVTANVLVLDPPPVSEAAPATAMIRAA